MPAPWRFLFLGSFFDTLQTGAFDAYFLLLPTYTCNVKLPGPALRRKRFEARQKARQGEPEMIAS